MIKLEEFKENGFKITWSALLQGYAINSIFSREILATEIINYAISKLKSNYEDKLICELAILNQNDTFEIENILRRLSEREDISMLKEFKKLRCIYVGKKLNNQNDNFIDGIMELNNMWIKLGYPNDSPHVFQGINNNITPQEYFTEENYKKLFNTSKIWLEIECELIKEMENM